jgi:exodeoxyribonuclease V gamma subunit
MTLWAYRDTRAERLVERLAATLAATWPEDPMARVTVVIGSRGMQRWLSHELATLQGSIAAVDFLFPGNAFAQAGQAIHEAAGEPGFATAPAASAAADAWSGTALHRRVISAIRARLGDPAFERVHGYLGDCDGPVGAREFAFTREVATTLDRLLYDRPEDAEAWRADPSVAGEHRWLAQLLADLMVDAPPTDPPSRLARLRSLPTQQVRAPLFVFGLSSLRHGDKVHLAELARHMDIHLFMLVPSTEWWADIRLRAHERAALKQAQKQAQTQGDSAAHINELLRAFERSNQMLAAHGAPSRDLQLWLEDLGYQTVDEDPEPDVPRHRLQVLQRWIDAADEAPELRERMRAGGVIDHDTGPLPSIEINACHGALRQCEALRDDLLRRFAADPTLEPRHVLVMTPDLATYAPLIAAVFGRDGIDGVPAIPVHIADLGLTDINPVAAVLLDVIGLVGSRVTASKLLDLLGREPLRAKFRIDDDDLGALQDLIVSSGLRWAWDAEDRARHDQPAVDQNTVRFALERLALGVLMPDPGGVAVVPAANGLGPAVPVDLPGRDHAERFGTLAEVCDRLQRLQQQLTTPATAGAWRARLEAVVDALCTVPESRAWQRTRVSTTLQELLADEAAADAAADAGLEFDPTSIAAMLRDAFTVPRGGDRPNTGAVTVCAMEPMRSVPFRIVAMVGMDDDSFPRPSRPAAWDPFATAKPQEHDRRSLDRHLFLESLLCARDALLIYGRGFEPARGEDVPLSVVVEEFADLLAQALGVEKPRDLLRIHPLQPWSLKAFEDATRRPFDPTWAEAALAQQGERRLSGLAATPADAEWPPETEPPTTLTARELARALENAPQAFLEKTLGLSMRNKDKAPEDREPIELDDLEAWKLRDALIKIVAADKAGSDGRIDARPLFTRRQGEGLIPFEAGGEAMLADELATARSIVNDARKVPGVAIGAATHVCAVVAPGCAPITITAVVPDVREDAGGACRHVWTMASSEPKDKVKLEAWLAMLVARIADSPVVAAHVIARKGKPVFNAPDKETALRVLEACVDLWWRIRRQPVPLVPRFSARLAELAEKTGLPPQSLVREGIDAWFEDDGADTAMKDDAVRALFGGWTEDDLEAHADTLFSLAQTVWSPLRAATVKAATKQGNKR